MDLKYNKGYLISISQKFNKIKIIVHTSHGDRSSLLKIYRELIRSKSYCGVIKLKKS